MCKSCDRNLSDHLVATGFDLEPLANGNVRIEFFGEDGTTCITLVVTKEVIESMSTVASLALACMNQGPRGGETVDASLEAEGERPMRKLSDDGHHTSPAARVRNVVAAFCSLWEDAEIPVPFEVDGQTFEERCEAWVLHAIDRIDEEIEWCRDCPPEADIDL